MFYDMANALAGNGHRFAAESIPAGRGADGRRGAEAVPELPPRRQSAVQRQRRGHAQASGPLELHRRPAGRQRQEVAGAMRRRLLDKFIGGWQVAGTGFLVSRYWTLPTDVYPNGKPLEIYGYKYPIQDCTQRTPAIPGYLWWNGYIPANQINSYDANGKPNGDHGRAGQLQARGAAADPVRFDGACRRTLPPNTDDLVASGTPTQFGSR